MVPSLVGRLELPLDAGEWEIIRSILAESEGSQPVYTARDQAAGSPRRVARPRPGLTLRRERSGDGWIIHLTGRDATGLYVDRIFEEIERMVGTGSDPRTTNQYPLRRPTSPSGHRTPLGAIRGLRPGPRC